MTESRPTIINADDQAGVVPFDNDDPDLADTDAEFIPDDVAASLPGQRVRVTLSDGSTILVRISNRERLLWDRTAPKRKWGSHNEVPSLAMTFLTWAAAVRSGQFEGKYEEWEKVVEDWDMVATEEVFPTR